MKKTSFCRDLVLATVLATMLSALLPGVARADGLFIPFIGANFGGDSGKEFGDAIDASRFNWGASIAWMGGGVFGVEGDFGFSPDFFGKSDLGDSSVFTATGNLLLGVPFGGQQGFGVRPYGLVGIGVIFPEGEAFEGDPELFENKASWDFGGGIMVFFGSNAGLRFDLRYFRAFEASDFLDFDTNDEVGNLDFARGSFGFVLRW